MRRLELAADDVRTEQEVGDDEQCREREAGSDVKHVLRQGLQVVEAGQRPKHAGNHCRHCEPAPESRPRECERRRGHYRKIEIERPIIWLFGRNDERCDKRTNQSEAGERGSMDQRGSERAEGDDTQQDEGGSRTDESVERVSRVDVGIGNRRSCRCEHARDMRLGQSSNAALDFAAPRPFAGGDQSERDDACEQDPRARTEPTLLD